MADRLTELAYPQGSGDASASPSLEMFVRTINAYRHPSYAGRFSPNGFAYTRHFGPDMTTAFAAVNAMNPQPKYHDEQSSNVEDVRTARIPDPLSWLRMIGPTQGKF